MHYYFPLCSTLSPWNYESNKKQQELKENKRYYEDLSWQIGDVSITRLVEVVLESSVETLFIDCTTEGLATYAS